MHASPSTWYLSAFAGLSLAEPFALSTDAKPPNRRRRRQDSDDDDSVKEEEEEEGDYDRTVRPARRRRIAHEIARVKRKRDPIDAVAALLHKRLRLCTSTDALSSGGARHPAECLLALLPNELVLAVMSLCDARSVARMACTSTRMAALASDDALWRSLYTRDFAPCPVGSDGVARCLSKVADAWRFDCSDPGADGLDHGSSGCSGAIDSLLRPREWWASRCARLSGHTARRIASDVRAPDASCPHHPSSLLCAHGYRWAYLTNARPHVYKVHNAPGHVHRIVHRGSLGGLGVGVETCSLVRHACDTVWRWGRFAARALDGLGTEVHLSRERGNGSPAVSVTSGMWRAGTGRGPCVHRSHEGHVVVVDAEHLAATRVLATDERLWGRGAMDEDPPSGTTGASDPRDMDGDHTTQCVIHYVADDGAPWSYSGGWARGVRSGWGVLMRDQERVYEGRWHADRWHGQGTLWPIGPRSSAHPIFVGRFDRGRPYGHGTRHLPNGVRATALWRLASDGRTAPKSRGCIVYANGDRATCDWGDPESPDDAGVTLPTVVGFTFGPNATKSALSGRELGLECGPWRVCRAHDGGDDLVDRHHTDQRDLPQVDDGDEDEEEEEKRDDGPVGATDADLPLWSGADETFCTHGWASIASIAFWPPAQHPFEPLFAYHIGEGHMAWSRSCIAKLAPLAP